MTPTDSKSPSLAMLALFPGQGSQFVGMGKDLVQNFKIAAEAFEEASEAVKKDLRKLCFDGPESDLVLTENTQPCLLVTSVAAFRVARAELGFQPAAVAGHSLGEYSALVAAGTLPLATAAFWVSERGRAMQLAVPAGEGTMAAILGLDDTQVARLCETATTNTRALRAAQKVEELSVEAIVEPANFNAPGQVVIAGSSDAVAEAIALTKAGGDFAGGKAIHLSVSAPFHCRLMKPARDRMESLFSDAKSVDRPKPPICPYVPNRTGRLTQEPGVVFELLVEQVDHPVLWRQSMTQLIQAGHTVGVEFGPGKVLAGLAKRIAQGAGAPCVIHPMGDSTNLKALETLLNASKVFQ
jgi:[acyl-carrier-protein] S-malonyltransferase